MIAAVLAATLACTPISRAAAHAIVSVDPLLVRAVIRNESNFDSRATSRVGAMGLMQLMPQTALEVGTCQPYDATENVVGGARYLRALLDRFHGNVRLAVAAYNAGPGAVERYHDIPPYRETQAYVRRVLGTYARYELPSPSSMPMVRPRPLVFPKLVPKLRRHLKPRAFALVSSDATSLAVFVR